MQTKKQCGKGGEVLIRQHADFFEAIAHHGKININYNKDPIII